MDFREDINNALKVLREGGVILYPTDTVWGLGCDATDPKAVANVFQIKRRKDSKSLIVLVNGLAMLERYVKEIPEVAGQILEVSDKPITIIYPKGKNLAAGVYSEDGSVGIRVASDNFCNDLITRFRKPVVSTSANISGSPSPQNFSEIEKGIIESAGYTVRFRQSDNKKYKPSSIIKIESDGSIKIVRE
jgi:L-threonylcarbamoyladenylate synthase